MAANASLMKFVPRGARRLAMLRPPGIGAICPAEDEFCQSVPERTAFVFEDIDADEYDLDALSLQKIQEIKVHRGPIGNPPGK